MLSHFIGGIQAVIMNNLLNLTIAAIASLGIAQTPAMALSAFSLLPNELTKENLDIDVETVAESMLFGFVCCQSLLLIKLGEL